MQKWSENFIWNENVENSAYRISHMFVAFLIDKFSIKQIKDLISELDKKYLFDSFNLKFQRIFGNKIESIEKDFINSLK